MFEMDVNLWAFRNRHAPKMHYGLALAFSESVTLSEFGFARGLGISESLKCVIANVPRDSIDQEVPSLKRPMK